MKIYRLLLASAIVFALTTASCGYIVTKIFSPNTCMKCIVIDTFGSEVWSEEDCGGGKYNMEQRCKAQAYDYEGTCECERYKMEEQ